LGDSLKFAIVATFKAVIQKGKRDLKYDGTSNVKIRVAHFRKTIFIATNLFVLLNGFDSRCYFRGRRERQRNFL